MTSMTRTWKCSVCGAEGAVTLEDISFPEPFGWSQAAANDHWEVSPDCPRGLLERVTLSDEPTFRDHIYDPTTKKEES